jgi:hypothetical protein
MAGCTKLPSDGVTVMGLALKGLWFDPRLPQDADPFEDLSNWYKVGVGPERVDALCEYVRETARAFGQKCLYLERAARRSLSGYS